MSDSARTPAQEEAIRASIRARAAARRAATPPSSTPDPGKGLMSRMADALRSSSLGDAFRNAGGGGGAAGQAKRADMDRIVNEMVTGRQRAGQSTDKSNGY